MSFFGPANCCGPAYRDLWNSFAGGKHHVIGNHDMDRYTYEEYTQGMDMSGRYYSFDQGDFHFIVLDGNNLFDGKEYTHYARAKLFAREYVGEGSPDFCHEQARRKKYSTR